ncbi:hypothetical protein THAOC_29937, partial [Thalassiosira oceanica]
MGRQQIATNFLACRDLCIDTLSEVIWPAEQIKESCSVTKLAKFTGYFSATTGEKCDLLAERDAEVCDPGALSLLLAAKAGAANAVRDSSASVSMKDTKRRRVNRPSGREPPRRDSQSTPAPVKGTVLVDVNLLAETPNQSTPAPVKGTVLVDVNLLAETPNQSTPAP